MKADIQKIADEDPVMAQILELRAGFMYKDWQLFRERNATELAMRIQKRLRKATLFMALSTVWFILAFAYETFSNFGQEGMTLALLRALFAALSFGGTIFSMRQTKKTENLLSSLEVEQ